MRFSPLREAIITALETEIERIESVRGAWRADAADRHHKITNMLNDLHDPNKVVFMEIVPELKPGEIKL